MAETDVACSTIGLLLAELGTVTMTALAVRAVLATGANRRTTQPGLLDALRTLVAAAIRGDPAWPRRRLYRVEWCFLVSCCTTI